MPEPYAAPCRRTPAKARSGGDSGFAGGTHRMVPERGAGGDGELHDQRAGAPHPGRPGTPDGRGGPRVRRPARRARSAGALAVRLALRGARARGAPRRGPLGRGLLPACERVGRPLLGVGAHRLRVVARPLRPQLSATPRPAARPELTSGVSRAPSWTPPAAPRGVVITPTRRTDVVTR